MAEPTVQKSMSLATTTRAMVRLLDAVGSFEGRRRVLLAVVVLRHLTDSQVANTLNFAVSMTAMPGSPEKR